MASQNYSRTSKQGTSPFFHRREVVLSSEVKEILPLWAIGASKCPLYGGYLYCVLYWRVLSTVTGGCICACFVDSYFFPLCILPLCTVVECPELSEPEKSAIEYSAMPSVYNSRAEYRCASGYMLDGDRERVCQSSGAWSGSSPTCRRK